MPEAVCLGSILQRDDYETSFMKAAPLAFAGTDHFAKTHGWQTRLGFVELRPDFPLGGNSWGLDDEDIYEAAFQEIEHLVSTGNRFALSLTNIGGHAPYGFVSRSCNGRPSVDKIEDPVLRAFRCTHELAAEFITRLEAAGYLNDTVVVVQSDHLAMRNTVFSELKKRERRNLFFAFGAGVDAQTIDRHMTMVDIFPTLLDMLGYQPTDGRAGLGVSAFSKLPTLVEEQGLSGLDRAIYADSELRNKLWGVKRNTEPSS